MKANAVIKIGLSLIIAACIAASRIDSPSFTALLCELDDQDCVLTRKTDEHYETYLAVDIVRETS